MLTALDILKTAPLGAYIAFSDGTPRPPERFNKKLSAWKNRNGGGILTEKTPGTVMVTSDHVGRASFALRIGEYGTASTIAVILNVHFDDQSDLQFEIKSTPTGTVRINQYGALIPPQDIANRALRGYADPQPGETDQPAGYGAGYPSPIAPDDQTYLTLPGVTAYLRHPRLLAEESASLIAVRDDGYHVTFPRRFCSATVAKLDTLSDDDKRALLLRYLKNREDGVIAPPHELAPS